MTEVFSTYYQSPLGLIHISGAAEFITEISFIDTVQHAPSAPAENGSLPKIILDAVEELIQYFQGERTVFGFPIQQEGTDFQKRVWHELMEIPYGKTISYLELSKRLGDTKAIRAAASANGKNNIAVVVPCHRVIGSRNDLVGYAGGLWRKRWLLEHENKIANGVQTLF